MRYLKNKQVYFLKKEGNKLTDVENKLMVTSGGKKRKKGKAWEKEGQFK